MEDLRKAAKYYLETAPEEYKKRAQKVMDDGESLEDFYVRETKRCIRKCNVCSKLLVGFYMCCTKCEFYKSNYNLCVECFYGRAFQHDEHDTFADNHSVMMMLNKKGSEPSCVIEKTTRKIKIDKEGLEKLAEIAGAHYDAAPQKIRESADDFFWSMVKQKGKTRVTVEDFLEYMNGKSYSEYAKQELFEMVVKDRNVGMDIKESRTVYYIVVSRRPFCSWCNCFITDIYFCCSKCSARSYALCLVCYSDKAYVKHRHYGDDDAFFLDYTVLHNTITATPADTSEASGSGSSSSTAIEIRKPRDDNVAADVLKFGRAILNAGAAVLSIASSLGACTIM
nr:acetyl-CoA synthetase [Ipomoea batatas]